MALPGETLYSGALTSAPGSVAQVRECAAQLTRIFATDIADRMLNSARTGVYPAGIEGEISPQRLERFFEKEDAYYRVRRELPALTHRRLD